MDTSDLPHLPLLSALSRAPLRVIAYFTARRGPPDGYGLHLVNLIKDRIGEVFLPYVHPHFDDQQGERVLIVRCEPGPKAAFLKDGKEQRFFVRGGNATTELSGAAITDYINHRF